MDPEVRSAISLSHLRALPPDVLERLVAGTVRVTIPPGSVTHREGETVPHLELVISGIVRVFVAAPDGRTMTVRYCRRGALIGALSLFPPRFIMPASVQALVGAQLLQLRAEVVRESATRDLRVAHALLRELSERAASFVYEITGSAFATVRQRVARHLLDLASEQVSGSAAGSEIVVPVTQQELADAAGTAREVVVRVLRELRRDGVVRTGRGGIMVCDPERLIREQGWNQSS